VGIPAWTICTPFGEYRVRVQFFGPTRGPEEADEARSVWFFASCDIRNLEPDAIEAALELSDELSGGVGLGQRVRMDDAQAEQLIEALDDALAAGLIYFERIERSAPPPPRSVEEPEESPAPEVVAGTFDLQVVLDGDGSGVGQLSVEVKTQGEGGFRGHRTDGGGSIRVEHVVRGAVDVRSDITGARLDQSAVVVGWGTSPIDVDVDGEAAPAPKGADLPPVRHLIELEQYRVRDGDTPASVAARAGMSWPDLAYFNWGTRVPEEINRFLAFEVGSTQKGKSGDVAFKSSDQPGLIRIPRRFSRSDLPTDTKNVLRVRFPRFPFGRCFDMAEQPIAGKRFVVFENEHELFSGTTDSNGWLVVPFEWKDTFEVHFPEAGSSATT
jgi:hypothetical protein